MSLFISNAVPFAGNETIARILLGGTQNHQWNENIDVLEKQPRTRNELRRLGSELADAKVEIARLKAALEKAKKGKRRT